MRLIAAIVLLIGISCPALADDLVVGQPAPPIVLHTLEGATVATADLRGKVTILNFWATWCVPCRQEMPLLSNYAAKHAGQVQVLGFSLDSPGTLPEVKRVAATVGFPVGLLGSAWAGGYGRMWRLPVSFVIDRNGILRHDGWRDDQLPLTAESLERIVTPLLPSSP